MLFPGVMKTRILYRKYRRQNPGFTNPSKHFSAAWQNFFMDETEPGRAEGEKTASPRQSFIFFLLPEGGFHEEMHQNHPVECGLEFQDRESRAEALRESASGASDAVVSSRN